MANKVIIPQDITDVGKQYLVEHGCEVIVGSGNTDISVLKREVAEADALLVRTAPYPSEVIAAAPRLKVIGRHGVGVDNIDVQYCSAHGIRVTYAPESNAISVAEHTIALMLVAARHISRFDVEVRNGGWAVRNQYKGIDLDGKTVGLIGLGRIGNKVADKAIYGFNMKVIAFDAYLPKEKYRKDVEMQGSVEDVFKAADFISLHTPATAETRGMVNASLLSLVKPGAALVNCARGELCSLDDLDDALKHGNLGAAALDVFPDEPPKSHPILKNMDAVFTPHSAALTIESMNRMGLHAAMGIVDVLSGKKPQWAVN